MRSRDWSSDVCSSDLAGDRAVDQLRIERRQRVVTKAETIHHARPVVLDDDVAFRRQIAREHDAGFALEIDDDAFLAAIATEKVVALAVTERREPARVGAPSGRLDLQPLSAEEDRTSGALGKRGCAR